MRITELKSRTELSRYVESYWYFGASEQGNLTLIPDGTFNVFIAKSSFFKLGCKTEFPAGNYLIPITTKVIQIQSKKEIFGIRFKAFSLANIVGKKVCLLNEINRLDDCLDKSISLPDFRILLCEQNEFSASRMHLENLAFDLLNHRFLLNENLRYKVNYILNRKGDIRIETLCAELGISRQGLHKSFKDGLGIGPKDLAKTWRLNHYFMLMSSGNSLTETAIDAGFYDQAHSINAFKSQWSFSPLQLRKNDLDFFQFASDNITKRFNNYYDPEL